MGNCIQREIGIESTKENKIDDTKILKNIVNIINKDKSKRKLEKSQNDQKQQRIN